MWIYEVNYEHITCFSVFFRDSFSPCCLWISIALMLQNDVTVGVYHFCWDVTHYRQVQVHPHWSHHKPTSPVLHSHYKPELVWKKKKELFKGGRRKLLVWKQNGQKPSAQESNKIHLHIWEHLTLLLISSLPPCIFTCVPTNRGPFHVCIQDKHIKNLSCGGVRPHAKQAEKSSDPALLEALFSCQGSGPWKRLSILKAVGGEDPAWLDWWDKSYAKNSWVKILHSCAAMLYPWVKQQQLYLTLAIQNMG